MNAKPIAAPFEKHFTSSILLWVRSDRARQAGMDHWKGPHAGIIATTPGLIEYRQVHLVADNPGRWPAIEGIETRIPADRRSDFRSHLREALVATAAFTELRSQRVLPWNQGTWDTPKVAHDSPKRDRLNGSLILGFKDVAMRARFFAEVARAMAPLLKGHLAVVHAHDVETALTFVAGGKRLAHPHA